MCMYTYIHIYIYTHMYIYIYRHIMIHVYITLHGSRYGVLYFDGWTCSENVSVAGAEPDAPPLMIGSARHFCRTPSGSTVFTKVGRTKLQCTIYQHFRTLAQGTSGAEESANKQWTPPPNCFPPCLSEGGRTVDCFIMFGVTLYELHA